MSEQIIIGGKAVTVPPEILTGGDAAKAYWEETYGEEPPETILAGGREAVAEWYLAQPGATPLPPVPPADVQALGDQAVVEWYRKIGHLPKPTKEG